MKRCPTCKQDLPLEDFPPSHRLINGKQCRKCHVSRIRVRELKTKYGLTPDAVIKMQERQHDRCLGCQQELPRNFCVDHDHATGKVRGLLCRPCNLVLGLVKEDRARLTRLRLYLDRDETKSSIYVIGSLRNREITKVSAQLRNVGHVVWDAWVAAGPEADDYWRDYEQEQGHDMAEALKGLAAQNVFYFDKGLIDLADIGVLIMPCGKSGHLELGYMAAQGKRTYVLLDAPPERFDVMAQFATGVYERVEDLIEVLSSSQVGGTTTSAGAYDHAHSSWPYPNLRLDLGRTNLP